MNIESFSPDASLDELLSVAGARFDLRFEPLKIGSYELQILQIADLEDYIDRLAESTGEGEALQLPFWAKIWPTSILLSYFLQRYPAGSGEEALELGAGVGICGLFAARHGFRVTLSDNNEDALLFTRINILKNNLQDRASVAKLDFTRDTLSLPFRLILASEILYRETSYEPLIEFLTRHLQPGGEAVLAKDYQLKARRFFQLAPERFRLQEHRLGYRERTDDESGSEKHLSDIYILRPSED
jgi:predicted nicotinamide N-methyase